MKHDLSTAKHTTLKEVACEICGDEYPADSLTPCETCSWNMCEACEQEQGNCRDCCEELGLIDENDT